MKTKVQNKEMERIPTICKTKQTLRNASHPTHNHSNFTILVHIELRVVVLNHKKKNDDSNN